MVAGGVGSENPCVVSVAAATARKFQRTRDGDVLTDPATNDGRHVVIPCRSCGELYAGSGDGLIAGGLDDCRAAVHVITATVTVGRTAGGEQNLIASVDGLRTRAVELDSGADRAEVAAVAVVADERQVVSGPNIHRRALYQGADVAGVRQCDVIAGPEIDRAAITLNCRTGNGDVACSGNYVAAGETATIPTRQQRYASIYVNRAVGDGDITDCATTTVGGEGQAGATAVADRDSSSSDVACAVGAAICPYGDVGTVKLSIDRAFRQS